MATNFPGSLDALTNPAGTSLVTSPDHAAQHANANDAIEAIEAKLGVGAGTPTLATKLLVGTGNGTSVWSGTVGTVTINNSTFGTVSVTGGTINNVVLGTPNITGGTHNNFTAGTPTLTAPVVNVGSDATGDLYYRNASGQFTRLGIGTANHILKSDGTTPSWGANSASKIAQITSTYDATLGTRTANTFADLIAGTLTVSAGSRIIVNTSVGYSHSTAGKRVGLQLVVDGGTVHTVYNSAGTTDANGNAGISSLVYRSGTLASGSRIAKVQWDNTDNSGSAYTSVKSLVLMEEIA